MNSPSPFTTGKPGTWVTSCVIILSLFLEVTLRCSLLGAQQCMEGGGQPSQLRQKIRPHRKRRNFQLVFEVGESTLLNGLFVEKAFLWHCDDERRRSFSSDIIACLSPLKLLCGNDDKTHYLPIEISSIPCVQPHAGGVAISQRGESKNMTSCFYEKSTNWSTSSFEGKVKIILGSGFSEGNAVGFFVYLWYVCRVYYSPAATVPPVKGFANTQKRQSV